MTLLMASFPQVGGADGRLESYLSLLESEGAPAGAVEAAASRCIRSGGEWAPSAGDFLALAFDEGRRMINQHLSELPDHVIRQIAVATPRSFEFHLLRTGRVPRSSMPPRGLIEVGDEDAAFALQLLQGRPT